MGSTIQPTVDSDASEGTSKVWEAREPGSVVLKFECKSESSESLVKCRLLGSMPPPPAPVSDSVVLGSGW